MLYIKVVFVYKTILQSAIAEIGLKVNTCSSRLNKSSEAL